MKEAGKERESRAKRTKKWLILFQMEYYLLEDVGLVFVLESVCMFLVPFYIRKLQSPF